MRRRLQTILAAVVAALAVAAPARAITFGTVDGNLHPNVGALVADFGGTKYAICSGTLVSPTVFLTAGHCTTGLTRVWVTFDSQIDLQGPSGASLLAGTAHTHPLYGTPSTSEPYDIGVVVLDRQVRRITPASLPSAGMLDRIPKPTLRSSTFVTVGYGVARDSKTGGPLALFDDGKRRYATQSFSNLLASWLDLSQNPATGNGGTCYGDSGGPHLLGSAVVSLTVTGDAWCRASDRTYRLDTPVPRAFLAGFVTLP